MSEPKGDNWYNDPAKVTGMIDKEIQALVDTPNWSVNLLAAMDHVSRADMDSIAKEYAIRSMSTISMLAMLRNGELPTGEIEAMPELKNRILDALGMPRDQ